MRRKGAYKAKTTSRQLTVGLNGIPETGKSARWVLSSSTTGLPSLTRTFTNNITDYYLIELRHLHDKLSGRGLKITSYKVHYTCNLSDTGDDVQFHLLYRDMPANGSDPTVTATAGDTDADYDAAHNTAAERVDATAGPHNHTATITVPTADQKFMDDDETWCILIKVIEADDASNNLAIVVKDISITLTQVL